MSSKNYTSWTDTKAKAREIREAAGTQRSAAEEAAAIEHLHAKVRAYHLAEVPKSQRPVLGVGNGPVR